MTGKTNLIVGGLILEMRDYRFYSDRRDDIIHRALDAQMPVERIATEMGISKAAVYRVQRKRESLRT